MAAWGKAGAQQPTALGWPKWGPGVWAGGAQLGTFGLISAPGALAVHSSNKPLHCPGVQESILTNARAEREGASRAGTLMQFISCQRSTQRSHIVGFETRSQTEENTPIPSTEMKRKQQVQV